MCKHQHDSLSWLTSQSSSAMVILTHKSTNGQSSFNNMQDLPVFTTYCILLTCKLPMPDNVLSVPSVTGHYVQHGSFINSHSDSDVYIFTMFKVVLSLAQI